MLIDGVLRRPRNETTYRRPPARNIQVLEASKNKAHESTDEDDEKRKVVALVEAERTIYLPPEINPCLTKGRFGVVP